MSTLRLKGPKIAFAKLEAHFADQLDEDCSAVELLSMEMGEDDRLSDEWRDRLLEMGFTEIGENV